MKIGSWMSLLGVLAGMWVMASPYLIGYAPKHGNPWSGIVLGTDILGAIIVVVSLLGLVAFWGLRLREISHRHSTLVED